MRVASSLCALALLLAGCAGNQLGSLTGGSTAPKPKSVAVSDFVFSQEVVAVDRGYTARLERKIGEYPTFERKQRTLERVNDEIVATIVVTLREAGLEARAANEDTLTLNDDALLITGRLRGADPRAKPESIGFGSGRSGVVADMSLSQWSNGGKRELSTFAVEPPKKPGATPAARNAAIMAAVGSGGTPAEKLSPDVETPARAIGRAVGEKIVAYARGQGWVEKAPEAPPPEPKPTRAQRPRPQVPKPAQAQPSAAAPPDAQQDAQPAAQAAAPPKRTPKPKPVQQAPAQPDQQDKD